MSLHHDGYDPQLRLRALRHQGDGGFHRYGDLSDKGDGPYQSKPHDKYFYLAIMLFIVFLIFLPKILRKFGCAPPRPQRWWEVEINTGENAQWQPELSEEERRELVEKSLFTTSVAAHSKCVCGTCSTDEEESSSILNFASKGSSANLAEDKSTSTGSTAQESEASPSDTRTGGTLQPCHICLEKFQVDDTVAWSNVSQCKHTFHKACIEEWMMKHEDCPCCRAETLHLPRPDENSTGSAADVRVVIHNMGGSESADENENETVRNRSGPESADQSEEEVEGDAERVAGEESKKNSLETTTRTSNRNGSVNEDGTRQEESFCFCVEHGLQLRSF